MIQALEILLWQTYMCNLEDMKLSLMIHMLLIR